jgi:hypothetical protein
MRRTCGSSPVSLKKNFPKSDRRASPDMMALATHYGTDTEWAGRGGPDGSMPEIHFRTRLTRH